MRRHLQLVAAILFGAAQAHAQIHAPQITLHKKQTEDLSWLWKYTRPEPKGDENALIWDTRFKPFLQQHLTAPQTFWSKGKSLPDTVLEFLGHPRSVVSEDNRYITATGCVQEFCPNRGLLWVDLGAPHPLIVFAATNWTTENKATDQAGSTYTLWVFSNRALDPIHLPKPLTRSIAPWIVEPIADGTVEQVANIILVDPDGQPHQVQLAALEINQNPKRQTDQKAQP
jgi:hypothetical protein